MPSNEDSGFQSDPANEDTFPRSELDWQLVEKIKAQALIDSGFVKQDEDDNTVADEKQLPYAVLQAMTSSHVVTGKRDFATKSVTKFELYSELFPNGPGVRSLAESPEAKEAQEVLTRKVWAYLNTGTTGYVQKNVSDSGLVLCEGSASRTLVNVETGKKEPTTQLARFLTSDREMILGYYTAPAGAAFIRAARKLEAQLGMVGDRRPELVEPIARQLDAVVRQAVLSIPHANVKQVSALTAGTADENDAE